MPGNATTDSPTTGALRRRWLVVMVCLMLGGALMAWDLQRPPAAQWSVRLMLRGIDLYQRALSGHASRLGASCRFRPSCSRYAAQALRRHGAVHGTALALRRIVRCGPWTAPATADPVPPADEALASAAAED